MSGVIEGLAQFFTPTNLLAVIALGLMLGQYAKRASSIALAAFSLGLALGSIAIAAAMRETPAAIVLLGVAAVTGTVVALALSLPPIISYAFALVIGTALALNSPPQAIAISSAIAAQFGTAIASLATLALAALVATTATRPWQRIGLRILASWIAASAILVLAVRLARHGAA